MAAEVDSGCASLFLSAGGTGNANRLEGFWVPDLGVAASVLLLDLLDRDLAGLLLLQS